MPNAELSALLDDVSKRVAADPACGLIEARPLFEDMLARGLHIVALNDMLSQLDSEDAQDIFTSGKFLVIGLAGDVELTFVRYTRPGPYIFSSPNNYLQASLSGGGFTVDRYRSSHPVGGPDFDPGVSLDLVSSRRADDRTIIVKRLEDIVHFRSFTREPTIFVRLAQLPDGDFEWAFDRASRRAHSFCTIRLAESNLCGLFDLLAETGDERTVETVAHFVEHPLHFVRWKAVQTIGRHDRARGLELARRALDDIHPHVRAAARATLASLEARG